MNDLLRAVGSEACELAASLYERCARPGWHGPEVVELAVAEREFIRHFNIYREHSEAPDAYLRKVKQLLDKGMPDEYVPVVVKTLAGIAVECMDPSDPRFQGVAALAAHLSWGSDNANVERIVGILSDRASEVADDWQRKDIEQRAHNLRGGLAQVREDYAEALREYQRALALASSDGTRIAAGLNVAEAGLMVGDAAEVDRGVREAAAADSTLANIQAVDASRRVLDCALETLTNLQAVTVETLRAALEAGGEQLSSETERELVRRACARLDDARS
ncbi:MAG: hypothetical protein GY711_07185 [bacterium]|nr:hypothetical protein [bacterium]